MKNLDTDGDGVISYQEFLSQAFTICMLVSESKLRDTFQLFDLNEDGSITN
jgi:Ca2+-binding EF-hand superfamily protein